MAGGDENSRVRAALPLGRGRLLSESWKLEKYHAGPWPGAAGIRRDSYFRQLMRGGWPHTRRRCAGNDLSRESTDGATHQTPTQAAPAARPAPLEAKSPAVLDGIGATAPFAGNGKCWDPVGFTERTEDSLMLWYRAAELKHSRVAMLACTGWLVNQYELYFPGNLAAGKAFSSLGKNPLEAWAATPYDGKVQILFAIGLAEFHSEFGKTAEGKGYKQHFTRGGPFPGNQIERTASGWQDVWGGKVLNIPFGPEDTDQKFRIQQNAELNNGRLAMIGIMGFSAAALVPGSVPALDGLDGVVAQGWTIGA